MDGWMAIHPWASDGHGPSWRLRPRVRGFVCIPSILRLVFAWLGCFPLVPIGRARRYFPRRWALVHRMLRSIFDPPPPFRRWKGRERSRGKDPIRWGLVGYTNGSWTIGRFRSFDGSREIPYPAWNDRTEPRGCGRRAGADTRRGISRHLPDFPEMQDDPRRVRKARSGESIEDGSFCSFLSKSQLLGRACPFVPVSWRGVYFPIFPRESSFSRSFGLPVRAFSASRGSDPWCPFHSPWHDFFGWCRTVLPPQLVRRRHTPKHICHALCCGERDRPDTPGRSCRSIHTCDARGLNHGDEEKGRKGRTRVPTSNPPSVTSSPGRSTTGERIRETRGVRDASKRTVATCTKDASTTPRNTPRQVPCPTR